MFNSIIIDGLTINSALICMAVSLGAGLLIAFSYSLKSSYTKNFLITLIILPVIVQAVIMMVNGNIGTGVAVLGAFSLIRFRSIAGNSKEISCIFFAMAVGIATGIGQIYFAIAFVVLVCAVFIALKFIPIGKTKQMYERELKITVPEDLDFETELGMVFKLYTKYAQISKIKTSSMGSLFVITYQIKLIKLNTEKNLIDDLRIKNGNLPIICKNKITEFSEL